MGLFDSLNPFTIGFQIILLIALRNKQNVIWYIVGTFFTYFLGGILIFVGVDALLRDFFENIFTNPTIWFFVVEFILGLLMLGYCLSVLFKKQSLENNREAPKKENWFILFVIGAAFSVIDVPTALPYIAFIGKMLEMKIELVSALPFFILYNLLYILPLIIIQILYSIYHEKMSEKLLKIKYFLNKANKIIIIGFSGAVSLLLLIDSVLYFIGFPIKW